MCRVDRIYKFVRFPHVWDRPKCGFDEFDTIAATWRIDLSLGSSSTICSSETCPLWSLIRRLTRWSTLLGNNQCWVGTFVDSVAAWLHLRCLDKSQGLLLLLLRSSTPHGLFLLPRWRGIHQRQHAHLIPKQVNPSGSQPQQHICNFDICHYKHCQRHNGPRHCFYNLTYLSSYKAGKLVERKIQHSYWSKFWPPDGTNSISSKFTRQMVPFALVTNLH